MCFDWKPPFSSQPSFAYKAPPFSSQPSFAYKESPNLCAKSLTEESNQH
jgi:hypothetical protein